ncbi:pimeloyl-ACP methyl ester carboxylesterase [Nocardioides cavernae]|uniref:Pimeloyl-ACP methyl ester carboxylesterase n=1 Tax=Nocardioides cavernae TaxID=1921566 RepID=A0A7Y9GZU6_9ACTN|nr:alpha/beta hydrolase [Nocardioides cavernae]NYE35404.1 pimeloyl-ACP methyl ester carboxylesterase [Nocardioides cavernae]
MSSPRDASSPVVSDELRAPVGNQVELCYQTIGDPSDEPLLLVMGLSGPMTWWDEAFCVLLASAGFHVVRYDNRDTGRSSRFPAPARGDQLVRAFATGNARAPYSMSDLAEDATALLDHLGIESAHLVGVSMGGMIAQTVAIEHPTRVRSLTSISSTTGRRTVGWQHPSLLPRLIAPRKAGRDAYVETSLAMWSLIGSTGFPSDPETLRTRAGTTFDRGVSASGAVRQMLAILTQPDRTPRLRSLRVPALVIHGTEDKMVHVSGGRSTAAAIPGAELLLVDGMGHDLPPELFEVFVDAIVTTAERARTTA